MRSANRSKETQERQRAAEARITEVDTKNAAAAAAAAQAAQAAQSTATQAGTAASAANTAATAAGSAANAAAGKADAVDKATKRLVYEVVLSEDEGKLQVRQDRPSRRGQGEAGSVGGVAQGRSEGRGTSRSKAAPTMSAIRRRMIGLVSSVPKRSSVISTNSTRSRCSRST